MAYTFLRLRSWSRPSDSRSDEPAIESLLAQTLEEDASHITVPPDAIVRLNARIDAIGPAPSRWTSVRVVTASALATLLLAFTLVTTSQAAGLQSITQAAITTIREVVTGQPASQDQSVEKVTSAPTAVSVAAAKTTATATATAIPTGTPSATAQQSPVPPPPNAPAAVIEPTTASRPSPPSAVAAVASSPTPAASVAPLASPTTTYRQRQRTLPHRRP